MLGGGMFFIHHFRIPLLEGRGFTAAVPRIDFPERVFGADTDLLSLQEQGGSFARLRSCRDSIRALLLSERIFALFLLRDPIGVERFPEPFRVGCLSSPTARTGQKRSFYKETSHDFRIKMTESKKSACIFRSDVYNKSC